MFTLFRTVFGRSGMGCFVFAFSAHFSTAQEYIPYDSIPGFVRHVRLLYSDQVSDNCWTNVSSVLTRARLSLEKNDVQVFDHDPAFQRLFAPILKITAVGYRSGSLCVGKVSVEIYFFGYVKYGGAEGNPEYRFRVFNEIFDRSSVFSSGQNLNEQIDDFVDGSISEFLADAVAARRDPKVIKWFEAYPDLGDVPIKLKGWDKLIVPLTSDPYQ